MAILFVSIGGAMGAAARFLLVQASARAFGTGFPWGVLAANVGGSFLIGLASVPLLGETTRQGWPAALLVPGFLGGFTTFSAYSLDSWLLIEEGRFAAAAFNAGGSVILSLLALGAGLTLGRAIFG